VAPAVVSGVARAVVSAVARAVVSAVAPRVTWYSAKAAATRTIIIT
jgi:hypothetical protein